MALIETVCARESEEAGRDIDLAELMLRGIRHLYESEPARKDSAAAREGKRARGTTHGGSPPRKRRRPHPELVTIQCRTCREAAVSTREGKPLDEMTHVGHREGPDPEFDPELEAILTGEIPEPAALDVPPVDRGLVCLDDIPRTIDAVWWRRFGGLFEWARNRRTLQFRPGPGGSQRLEARDRAGADRGARLSDLVGHTEAIARLEAILFTGMAGLGKTTLAHGYAGEAGSPLHATHGGTLDDPTSLLGLLAGLGRGHVLFIDEAHAVPQEPHGSVAGRASNSSMRTRRLRSRGSMSAVSHASS